MKEIFFGKSGYNEIFLIDKYGDPVEDTEGNWIIVGITEFPNFSLSEGNHLIPVTKEKNSFDYTSWCGFMDVFGLDDSFNTYKKGLATYLYLMEDNIYQGGVWIFEDENFFGIYGIRISLYNYFTGKRGTATKILQECLRLAGSRTLIVPWPLEGMIPLLRKFNFVDKRDRDEDSPERKFLTPITRTSSYWTHNN